MSRTIVVLLPGRTASTLVAPGQAYDAPDPVWPAAVARDLSAARPDERAALAAMERIDLRPGAPVGATPLGPGYGPFLRYFADLGFAGATARYAAPGVPAPLWGLSPGPLRGDLLLSFPYDWRRDCTANAALLGNLLATVDGLHGPSGYRLFLVGHSMGGLVARAYLENVGRGDAWLSRIHGLVTLGTPHLGMPGTLAAILGPAAVPPGVELGAALAALNHDFVDTAGWDGSHELLPPPVLEHAAEPPFTRYIQDGSGGAWYNLLDPGLPPPISEAVRAAAARGLPAPGRYAEDLAGAARFFGTLSYTGAVPGAALPSYRCVVGLSSAAPTVVGFTWDGATRTLRPRTDATGGDEVVPAWSAAFTGRTTPVAETFTAGGVSHFQLPADPGVLRRVAAWIGAAPPSRA